MQHACLVYNTSSVTFGDINSREKVYVPQLQKTCFSIRDSIVKLWDASDSSRDHYL